MFPLLLALDLHAQQTRVVLPSQPEASAPAPTGTGAITGAVTDAATGRPVSGAIVMLEERRPGSSLRVRSYSQVTTPKGRFAFLNLPAAETYLLTSTKLGYLDGGHGRIGPRGPGTPITLKDDEWLGVATVHVELDSCCLSTGLMA